MKIQGLNVTHYSSQEIITLIAENNIGIIGGVIGSIIMIGICFICVFYVFPFLKIYSEEKKAQNIKKIKRASLQKILVQKEIEEEIEKEMEEDSRKALEEKNK